MTTREVMRFPGAEEIKPKIRLEHQLALARKFLENHGYRVTRIAEMDQVELSKREARELGLIFDKELVESGWPAYVPLPYNRLAVLNDGEVVAE